MKHFILSEESPGIPSFSAKSGFGYASKSEICSGEVACNENYSLNFVQHYLTVSPAQPGW